MRTLFAILILTFPCFSLADPSKNSKVVSSAGPQVSIARDKSGELIYMVPGLDGKPQPVSTEFFENGLKKAIETAKDVVCKMNVLPQTVTVSSVVVSVTYETKQFCPKQSN
ncbi:MAG: hypothetical protein HYX41_07900 [Bdellovibrio sp.]|nr:hypothetical protein [Bdellovibrio sp.]